MSTAPQPDCPAALDALLDHVAAHLDGEAPRLALLDGRDALAFVVIRPAADDPDNVTVEAGSRGMSKAAAAYVLRAVADEFDDAARAEGDEPIPYTLTEQAEADEDVRPVITVDLDQPTEPAVKEQPAGPPKRVRCAHDYWLMQDSCPGCDHEQETPHEADPVTVRPRWAKRDMRRCRRCALVPSHKIHRATAAEAQR